MNGAHLRQLLEQLPASLWQALREGKALSLLDDERLESVKADGENILIPALNEDTNIDALRQKLLESTDELIEDYYRRTPLSRNGFTRQASELIKHHGATAFAAHSPHHPRYSLFVDCGQLLAEERQSPRHPYGVYCELPTAMEAKDVEAYVDKWLQQGEAYEEYLGMNVCRYSCC